MKIPHTNHELKGLCASCLREECSGRDEHRMNATVCGLHQPVTLEHLRSSWKEQAEAPCQCVGMKQSLAGLVRGVSEMLERADGRNSSSGQGHYYAFVLRELHRNLHEVWERRGEPGIVAEFGSLYYLDCEQPTQEPEDDDEEGGAS